MAIFGYAGRILKVDLSTSQVQDVPTAEHVARLVGGRGLAAGLYWDEVPPEAGAFDAENLLLFVTGPLAGVPAIGGSRWQVCGKSPATRPEQFCYGNLGGWWGAELKSAGYDAVAVKGKSREPVYLWLHDGKAELRDASELSGKGAKETREALKSALGKSVRVATVGPAGEVEATMATVMADNDASGAGGLGGVMGSKRLKAIAVKGGSTRASIADPDRLRELIRYFRQLGAGAAGRVWGIDWVVGGAGTKKDVCYGCLGNCVRVTYQAQDGTSGKFMCQPSYVYRPWVEEYYQGPNEANFHFVRLCNEYGLDTKSIGPMINWLVKCRQAGILSDEQAGIPISRVGSVEFIETLARRISFREGFGDILAGGTLAAAASLGRAAQELITDEIAKAGQIGSYDPRLYISTGLLYATEPRQPIQQLHEISMLIGRWMNWVKGTEPAYVTTEVLRKIAKRFFGTELAVDFSTCDGKALAAKMIQDREYAKECLILCDFLWPIVDVESTEDHVGDPTLESKLFSAVTGTEMDEAGFYELGERVLNLHRAIFLREGHRGRTDDTLPEMWYNLPKEGDAVNPECLMPGKNGTIISRKGSVVDRDAFESMKDEYYTLRGWDIATGLPTRSRLLKLGLAETAKELADRDLAL